MYKDNYNIKGDCMHTSMPSAEAGKNFPEGGVSGIKPKYSSGKDRMIGTYRGNGLVNDDANETPNWSEADTLETGLILRQPL